MSSQDLHSELGRYLSVQSFLYKEARLLDDKMFDEWLSLFTDDGEYILPIKEGPAPEPAIIRDSRFRIEERVYRLTHTLVHSQNPRSRTQHDVTNIEILGDRNAKELEVACNQSIHEIRPGSYFQPGLATQRSFHVRCRFRLLPHDESWKIRLKHCELLNREFPIHNLTFII